MIIEPVNITLTRARIKEEVWSGEYDGIVIVSVSDLSANPEIQINTTSENLIPVRPGWSFRPLKPNDKIKRIFMTNDAVAAGEVEFIFLDGAAIDLISRITTQTLEEGITTTAVTVTDVATPLPAVALSARILFGVQNYGANQIALIPSGGSFSSGWKIEPDSEVTEYIGPSAKIYAICDTGLTSDVIVLEGK